MKIRLSGTCFERLLYTIVPWTVLMSLLLYFIKTDIKNIVITFLLATAAFWLIDSAAIFFKYKNPKKLIQKDGLYLGKEPLNKDQIIQITPVTDKRPRWSFEFVELKMLNGSIHMIIDKPRSIIQELTDKPSKTILKLTTIYPELKDRISNRKYI